MSLWRDPDDVSHCRILSPDKTEWWLISAILRCFVADQLWLMTRMREEEEDVHAVHTAKLLYAAIPECSDNHSVTRR